MSGVLMVLTSGGSNLAATTAPDSISGSKIGLGTVETLGSTTVTVHGGRPPYEYSWTYVSGDVEVSPRLSAFYNTRFFAYFDLAETKTAGYKCVVTDAVGSSVDTNTVSISLTST